MEKKYFNPNSEIIKASEYFIKDLSGGIIEKSILPNTSEQFNTEKAAKSIDTFANSPAFLAIANK